MPEEDRKRHKALVQEIEWLEAEREARADEIARMMYMVAERRGLCCAGPSTKLRKSRDREQRDRRNVNAQIAAT